MKYIKGTLIPAYVLERLKIDDTTIISRSSIVRYGEDGIKEIFRSEGMLVDIEISLPLSFKKMKRTSKYPKDATYLLHRI